MTTPSPEALERALAERDAELAQAQARQVGISDVLRLISEVPHDLQRVLDTIAERTTRLCAAEMSAVTLIDGELVRLSALYGVSDPRAQAATRAMFPLPLGDSYPAGRAIIERTPVQVIDAIADEQFAFRHVAEAARLGCCLSVPMLGKDACIGSLSIMRTVPGVFAPQTVSLLQTFADQAVIAIENARLFRETQDALERQTATADVLKVIASSPTSVRPVFETIAERAAALCRGELGLSLQFDGDLLHLVGVCGASPDEEQALRTAFPGKPDRRTLSGRAVLERGPVQVFDMLADSEHGYRGTVIASGVRGGLAVPMLRDGAVVGAISVGRLEPGVFPQPLIALLQTFADQAVIAIENVRLFNETKDALEQQTATAEVLRVISSSVADTAPVFEKILDSCKRLFGSTHAGLFLLDENNFLHGGLHSGAGAEALNEAIATAGGLPLEATVSYAAIRNQRAVHYPDWSLIADDNSWHRAYYDALGNFSAVVAPMLWEGRGIGTIGVIRAGAERRPFTDKEIALISTFADQAVIAIENARLFHEIEDKSHQLERANQHKSEFLANMSHELRTPLNAVIGFSEVLIERMFGDLNEKQADYLNDIHTSGKHLLSLINDILDLSKIEAGRMELELEDFDVASALHNTLTLVRERAERHGIALSLDADLAPGSFRADQRKLKQIMLNLLSNAVKFTPDGGRIEVRATVVDDRIEVAVQDTGIGIAEEDQEAIFQEFRQAGGHYTNKQEGTGLGLALTRRFVELHGGTVRVASTPGHGSTFTFTLPRQP